MNVHADTHVKIERRFAAPIETVFRFVTEHDNLVKWWGPEGIHVTEETLDFTKPGPWHSVMVNADGQRFHVSGEVTKSDPPRLVAFTWAWHDGDTGARGPESKVRIELEPDGDATMFRLIHADLANDESRKNHEGGWTSSITCLERALNLPG